MEDYNDFKKYATKHRGISSLTMHKITSAYNSYISPTIIEERQLNVASMDVFSRLMMDRIIFLGLPVDDYVANVIQAQPGHNGCYFPQIGRDVDPRDLIQL